MHHSCLHVVWTDFLAKLCIPALGFVNFRVKHSSVTCQVLHERKRNKCFFIVVFHNLFSPTSHPHVIQDGTSQNSTRWKGDMKLYVNIIHVERNYCWWTIVFVCVYIMNSNYERQNIAESKSRNIAPKGIFWYCFNNKFKEVYFIFKLRANCYINKRSVLYLFCCFSVISMPTSLSKGHWYMEKL
jgi:hypothetical protein